MKPRLLLYLTTETTSRRNAVAATLAWACAEAGWFFEVYYDGYRLGEHYGGGDPDVLPPGYAAGGTIEGAHHHERLYLLLHRFDTTVIQDGPVAFAQTLAQLDVARLCAAGDTGEAGDACDTLALYRAAFARLGLSLPETLCVLDPAPTPHLRGLDAYYYPDVAARQALAVALDDPAEAALPAGWRELPLRRVALLGVGQERAEALGGHVAREAPGVACEIVDAITPLERFDTATERIARRHLADWTGGWILADPLTVATWLPEAVRERRLAVYGKPQRQVIARLAAELRQTRTAVLGRQYEDADFFELSALGVAFQLIDPLRPPFPVLRHAGYTWTPDATAGTCAVAAAEPDDNQLRRWAAEGRVLVSLIFWTGMIRELESLPRIVDLVALTRLRAGVALTVPAIEYQPEGSLELLRVPIEQGGVFPYLEILLASCGMGAAIESRLPEGRLAEALHAAVAALERLRLPSSLRPRGWWSTMDCAMCPLPRPRLPVTVAPQPRAPYVRLRYAGAAGSGHGPQSLASAPSAPAALPSGQPAGHARPGLKRRLGDWARERGLREVLAPYRPYELFAPGPFQPEIVPALRDAGLTYTFSKAGFGEPPRVLFADDMFVALNYTAGQWDGWTPFETINGLDDLRRAERRLLASGRPGWLVGTLDTCLWAFTGPIWQRGAELRSMAELVAAGGASGRLINVRPAVVARYARLIGERG